MPLSNTGPVAQFRERPCMRGRPKGSSMWTFNHDLFVLTSASRGDPSWPRRADARGSARLFNDRTRRRLVRSLRRLATRTPPRHAACRRFEVLLHERVALVRADLLEIAALLEHQPDPHPGCVLALHRLLADGCASPLYNHDIHPSELKSTLYYVRSRLGAAPSARVHSPSSARRVTRY